MYRVIAVLTVAILILSFASAFAGSSEVDQKVHSLLKQGKFEEALIEATRYLDDTERNSHDPFTFVHANKLVAKCLIAQDLNSEAETYLREALEIQVEERARVKDICETISALIHVYECQGKSKQADELNAFATAKYGRHDTSNQMIARDAEDMGKNTVIVTADEIPGKPVSEPIPIDSAPDPSAPAPQSPKGRNFERQYTSLSGAISNLQNILLDARDCDLAVKSNQANVAGSCARFNSRMSADWRYSSDTIKDLARDREFYMTYSKQFDLADRLMEDIAEKARYTSIRLRFRSK